MSFWSQVTSQLVGQRESSRDNSLSWLQWERPSPKTTELQEGVKAPKQIFFAVDEEKREERWNKFQKIMEIQKYYCLHSSRFAQSALCLPAIFLPTLASMQCVCQCWYSKWCAVMTVMWA